MSLIKKDGYDFAFNPKGCETCNGNCCIGESGNIWVNKEEIERLKNHLNISLEELSKSYIEKRGYKYSIREVKLAEDNYACIFFDLEKKQCGIYEARPTQCRTFPFWEYFKKNKEEVIKECPAIETL
ncbi:YkgJ family cysteine cluster protein [Halarcobacter bivalviorum]|uniref:Zinc/iron-chelating domain-containing protein n=1 Tax=Halarcobacter bivalviorum TaxID=663364 RepID=A0AAX2AAE8_9BACT|nr:YkgJ family cysteine cluster protein [Halarcobacter bivalviorum]AXH12641.1 putative [Fe-S] cluster-containing protein [Halarcobacter bivalviorum]RXK10435.1 zinc/iron-chelating domain-containing protein [Halarcobacter bivalviorum]